LDAYRTAGTYILVLSLSALFTVEAEILSAQDIAISLPFFTVQLLDLGSGVDKIHSRHTERRLEAL
jgi:hypothetical protein